MLNHSSREQEQSIKARKHELFAPESPSGPRRQFAEYLREAPPAPLSSFQKASLGAVGVLVALLFLAAILTVPGHSHAKLGQGRAKGAPAPAAKGP